MNTIIKRMLAFILSFALIFATTAHANANTSIGGWSALDTVTAGATNTINAAKTAGGKALKSSITVAASASKVGKHLIKGGGQAALAYAVVEILGEGIDWVLDPANNSVRYTDPTASSEPDPNHPSVQFYYTNGATDNRYATAVLACKASINAYNSKTPPPPQLAVYKNVSGLLCYSRDGLHDRLLSVPNPLYDPKASAPPAGSAQDRHIPIDTVAAKVISNAEAGHAPSQEVVKATALEGFAAGEHDAALDAAATETGTENPPDTENPPKDPEAPAEPFDPAGIISAINALKALLAGILSSITSLSDFFQSEPPPEPKPEDTELDIPIPDVVPVDTDINFGGSCPANFEFNGSMFGNPINIVLLDTSKFCGFLSTFVKFPVYAASSLFALYILGGRKDV